MGEPQGSALAPFHQAKIYSELLPNAHVDRFFHFALFVCVPFIFVSSEHVPQTQERPSLPTASNIVAAPRQPLNPPPALDGVKDVT